MRLFILSFFLYAFCPEVLFATKNVVHKEKTRSNEDFFKEIVQKHPSESYVSKVLKDLELIFSSNAYNGIWGKTGEYANVTPDLDVSSEYIRNEYLVNRNLCFSMYLTEFEDTKPILDFMKPLYESGKLKWDPQIYYSWLNVIRQKKYGSDKELADALLLFVDKDGTTTSMPPSPLGYPDSDYLFAETNDPRIKLVLEADMRRHPGFRKEIRIIVHDLVLKHSGVTQECVYEGLYHGNQGVVLWAIGHVLNDQLTDLYPELKKIYEMSREYSESKMHIFWGFQSVKDRLPFKIHPQTYRIIEE